MMVKGVRYITYTKYRIYFVSSYRGDGNSFPTSAKNSLFKRIPVTFISSSCMHVESIF